MTVLWVWSGAVTATTATVNARCSGSSARLGYCAGTSWTTPTYTSAVSVTNGIAQFALTGLTKDTAYTYRIEEDGTLDTTNNHLHTVKVGEAYSFTFAAASCAGLDPTYDGATANVSNSPVFGSIVDADPLFFIHMGDIHYRDITTSSATPFRTAFDDVLAESYPKAMFRAMPVVYMWDDHDFCGNDSAGDSTNKAYAQQVYRERVPSHSVPGSGAVYHTFVVGRVRFIVTDLRSDSSNRGDTDNDSKVMLGATQEAWFKATLEAATEELIVWVNTSPWAIASPYLYDTDSWDSFSAERTRLWRWIASNGWAERMLMISGDNHANSIATGTNNPWGRWPVAHFGSLDASTLTKGGPFDWTEESRGQFGTIEITDDGTNTIGVTIKHRRDGTVRRTTSLTYPRTAPAEAVPATMRTSDGLVIQNTIKVGAPIDGWR